jgi:deazaflavin-dependent oxidoreductase (nitroreductase family)
MSLRPEVQFFRAVNALVEPAVLAGCGAPGPWPTGLILLETTGARTGLPRRAPLLATVLEGCLFVSTARGPRAQWVKNLQIEPRVRYWLAGREHHGRAVVFAPGMPPPPTDGLPPLARLLADTLLPPATAFGWTFAVIVKD